jgi:hypothetical protein
MTAAGTGHTVIDVRPAAAGVEAGENSMHPLEIAIGWAWLAFWIYWLASAAGSKQSVKGGCQGLSDEFLVGERAIHLGGVEEGNATVDGGEMRATPSWWLAAGP